MVDEPKSDVETAVEEERKRLASLPDIPYDLDINRVGVLLSDEILYYVRRFDLIKPFSPDCLRPAGYELRVGHNYSIDGKSRMLKDFDSFEIGPYQVAVIELLETMNMPRFVIGRWNIVVSLAYKGLLWVGGAQVDPGFRGKLLCPIYNLSDQPVRLSFKQPIAMLDFETTTRISHLSMRFPWSTRKKIVFPQYAPDLLVSGITTRIERKILQFKLESDRRLSNADARAVASYERIQNRIDVFNSAILTVVSVLFAALGIIATRSAPVTGILVTPIFIAVFALYFALRSRTESAALFASQTAPTGVRRIVALSRREMLAGILVFASSIFFDARLVRSTTSQLTAIHGDSQRTASKFLAATEQLQRENDSLKREVLQLELEVNQLYPTVRNAAPDQR